MSCVLALPLLVLGILAADHHHHARRRITLQCSQRGFTDARTFTPITPLYMASHLNPRDLA